MLKLKKENNFICNILLKYFNNYKNDKFVIDLIKQLSINDIVKKDGNGNTILYYLCKYKAKYDSFYRFFFQAKGHG